MKFFGKLNIGLQQALKTSGHSAISKKSVKDGFKK